MRHGEAILLAMGGAALDIATPASGIENSWLPARQTPVVANEAHDAQVAQGFSPRPTEPAALFGRMLLPQRDFTMGPATCGFEATESNSFTCITNGATCTAQGGYVGCCAPNSACSAIKTTCINYSRSSAGACNLPSDYHTLCCATSTLAECYTWVVSTSAKTDDSVEPYTLYACSSTGGSGTLLTRDPSWPPESTSAAPAQTTAATSTASTSRGSDGGSSSSSSSNTGAIVGGAVGGAAGLALIGLAAFLIMRNKKKKSADTAAAAGNPDSSIPQPMGPSSPDTAYTGASQPGYQYGALPPQPGAPQQQSNYDPNMAYSNSQMYQQYPPQSQYSPYAAQQGYPASNVTPPPPPVSPGSPELYDASSVVGLAHQAQHPQPSELSATVPLGAENNRAELPSN